MSPPDRVQRLLTNAFDGDAATSVTRRGGPVGDVFVDVDRNLGRHGGKLWSVLVSVPFKDGTTPCSTVAGLWAAPPHSPLAFVGDVSDAAADGVPAAIVSKAGSFVDDIRRLDLGYVALDKDVRGVVDLLRDVLTAHAGGDEDALATALGAARKVVAGHCPSLAADLGGDAPATGPRP